MLNSRRAKIESLTCDGNLEDLKLVLNSNYTYEEINIAFELALAYSQIQIAEYLFSLGADFSYNSYEGLYYAVHNDEIEGVRFAIKKGVDINVNNGMCLNTSIYTAINSKTTNLVKWLLENGASIDLLSENSKQVLANFGNRDLQNLINKYH